LRGSAAAAADAADDAAAAPAAAPNAGPADVPVGDVAAQYNLACELHKELVATREELRRTTEQLHAARLDRVRARADVFAETLPVVHMLQDALGGAARQLRAARKRLLDPDVDNHYLDDLFDDRSYTDRDDSLARRQCVR
jgi:hypothetical protein